LAAVRPPLLTFLHLPFRPPLLILLHHLLPLPLILLRQRLIFRPLKCPWNVLRRILLHLLPLHRDLQRRLALRPPRTASLPDD
jgi:hypothetical protein